MPIPLFVKIKPVALPLLVSVNEVGVPRLPGNVNAIFLPVVVVIVLPASYACCKVTLSGFVPQLEISFEELTQSPTAPVLAPKTGIFVWSLRIISPVPSATNVKSSFEAVVISGFAPEKTKPVAPMVLLFKVWDFPRLDLKKNF